LKSGWQDEHLICQVLLKFTYQQWILKAVVHQAASQILFKSHGNRLSKKKGLMLCQSS
jgi:hypothetical protein